MFETGQRFEKRDVWHGPMQSRDCYHWNEDILPVPGSDEPFCKYAVVAYAHEGSRLMHRRPRTRLARTWKALRRLLDGCKRRYKMAIRRDARRGADWKAVKRIADCERFGREHRTHCIRAAACRI